MPFIFWLYLGTDELFIKVENFSHGNQRPAQLSSECNSETISKQKRTKHFLETSEAHFSWCHFEKHLYSFFLSVSLPKQTHLKLCILLTVWIMLHRTGSLNFIPICHGHCPPQTINMTEYKQRKLKTLTTNSFLVFAWAAEKIPFRSSWHLRHFYMTETDVNILSFLTAGCCHCRNPASYTRVLDELPWGNRRVRTYCV